MFKLFLMVTLSLFASASQCSNEPSVPNSTSSLVSSNLSPQRHEGLWFTTRYGDEIELTYNAFDEVVTVTFFDLDGRTPRIFSALMKRGEDAVNHNNFKIQKGGGKITMQCYNEDEEIRCIELPFVEEKGSHSSLYPIPYHLPALGDRNGKSGYHKVYLEVLLKNALHLPRDVYEQICNYLSGAPASRHFSRSGHAAEFTQCAEAREFAQRAREFGIPQHNCDYCALQIRNVDPQSETIINFSISTRGEIEIFCPTLKTTLFRLESNDSGNLRNFLKLGRNTIFPEDFIRAKYDAIPNKNKFRQLLAHSEPVLDTLPANFRDFVSNSLVAVTKTKPIDKIRQSKLEYGYIIEIYHEPTDFYMRVFLSCNDETVVSNRGSRFVAHHNVVNVFAQFRNPAITLTADSTNGPLEQVNRLTWNLPPSELTDHEPENMDIFFFIENPTVYLFRKNRGI